MNRILRPLLSGAVLLAGLVTAQAALLTEEFDTAGASANWNLLFSQAQGAGAPPPADDYAAVFGYDYSADSIAPAPSGAGTKGLKLQVNKDGTGAAAAVVLYPSSPSLAELPANYRLTFDAWMNLGVGSTTEQVLAGIHHSGAVPNHIGSSTTATSLSAFSEASDGIIFAMAGDNGISGTSTVTRDFATYYGQGGSRALLQTDKSFDGSSAVALGAVPPDGAPSGEWARMSIESNSNIITWKVNGVTITSFQNTSSFSTGTCMIGYDDPFASASPPGNFVIIDHLVLEEVAAATMDVRKIQEFPTWAGGPATQGVYEIQNLNTSDLTVTGAQFTGMNTPDFSSATAFPFIVPALSSAQLTLNFLPGGDTNGIRNANLTIISGDPTTPLHDSGQLRAKRQIAPYFIAHYKLDENPDPPPAGNFALTDSSGANTAAGFQVRNPVVFAQPSLLSPSGPGTAMGITPANTGTTGNYFTTNAPVSPSFSVSMWIKPSASGGTRTLFSRDPNFSSATEKIYGLLLNSGGGLLYKVEGADILDSTAVETPVFVEDDKVYHIAVTHLDDDFFANSTAKRSRLYVNGRLVQEKTDADTHGFNDYPFDAIVTAMHVGSRTVAGSGYSGDMDDVQIYGAELTPEQVWFMYRNPGATALQANFGAEFLGFDNGAGGTGGPVVRWMSSPDAAYDIFFSPDLSVWTLETGGSNLPGTADSLTTSKVLPPRANPAKLFWRVKRR